MSLRKALSNIPGWRTGRHIIVIESDDWGSIRTRSRSDYDAMVKEGLQLDTIFTKYDCLESNTDLERLFDVLSRHKDSSGRFCVFTPMCVMANPDFKAIGANGFSEFVYEPMPVTCEHYPNHDRTVALWHEGISKRLFMPALHAREHLNHIRWMENVRNQEGMRIAFKHQSIGARKYRGEVMLEYLGAFKPTTSNDLPILQSIVADAGRLFEDICGYKPTHFIAPNAEPMHGLDTAFAKIGVKYITNSKIRHHDLGDGKSRYEFTWLGKYYKDIDVINITRNGAFEQVDPGHDWVNECLGDISSAFTWHKPCVISSHRVNYIGSIDESNASKGLKLLDSLLSEIEKKWPDVEYMTSTELGALIRQEKRL